MMPLLATALTFGAPAHALEEPTYEIVGKIDHPEGAIEIRRYAPMTVARTRITGKFSRAGHQAFPRLGGYIFGANARNEKIEMTAPVSQAKDNADGYWISFVMPRSWSLQTLPSPRDNSVELIDVPARTMAVAMYRGGWSSKRYARHESRLLDAIASSHWLTYGEPEWARYNPPMWPSFLKRNEIMLPVRDMESLTAHQ